MRKNARADVFSQRATLSAEAFKKEAARRNVLASLRATQINASKPVLPAGTATLEYAVSLVLTRRRAHRRHPRLSPCNRPVTMCTRITPTQGNGIR